MPNNVFRGDAQDIAQVNTITVGGTIAATDVYTVTINRKEVSYTATGSEASSDVIASALQALLTSSTLAEYAEVSWTVSGAVITGTSVTAGKPFTSTSAATGSGTLVTATATASRGKSHWDDPDNWTLGTTPANGEDVFIENSSTDILYGVAQSGVTLQSLSVAASFTGAIGLPNWTGNYFEYRDKYLSIGASALNIGAGEGGGSGRVKINTGSVQTAITVTSTGPQADQSAPSFVWKGTHASNTMNALQGQIGVATDPGDTSTLTSVRVGSQQSRETDVSMIFGPGTTLTTLTQAGGTLTANAAVGTVVLSAGTLTLHGTGGVTSLTAEGGTVYYETSGTLTACVLRNSAGIDFSRDIRARTVTNITANAGTSIFDPFKTVTFTNPIVLNCRTSQLAVFDLGSNISIART